MDTGRGKESDQSKEKVMDDEATGVPSTTCHADGAGANSDVVESTLQEKEKDLCEMIQKNLRLDDGPPELKLDGLTLEAVAKYLQTEVCKNVIVMVGAGISTAAGIPDFRSPDTGIYFTLDKYNLPSPECMFDIHYFRNNPVPFYQLAKELFPSQFKPTICHYFLRLLNEKGKLLRLYTQNIDSLERVAGIPSDKIVEAHGSFYTSHCMNDWCHKEYDFMWMKEKIFDDKVPTCTECGGVGLIKPDIIFFGEELPERFHSLVYKDFPLCDLLIVIGTSLTVQPFAGLVDMVQKNIPRVLINNRKYDKSHSLARLLGLSDGFDFDSPSNKRDVFWQGTADDGCLGLARLLGWWDELQTLFMEEHTKIDQNSEVKETQPCG